MTYLIGLSSVTAGSERVEVYRSGQAVLTRRPLVSITGVTRVSNGQTQDHTRAVILDADGGAQALPLLAKTDLADVILDRVAALLNPEKSEKA